MTNFKMTDSVAHYLATMECSNTVWAGMKIDPYGQYDMIDLEHAEEEEEYCRELMWWSVGVHDAGTVGDMKHLL